MNASHLLRRFGLGATAEEMREFAGLSQEQMADRLLDYDRVDEGFDVSPWELCFEEGNDMVYLDPGRTLAWWSLRLLMTKRPLQERMTFFWHDHFAVSAQKVEFGPGMLDYLDVLRNHATGNFAALLKAVSKTPAMLRWLDADENIKGHPNENFAREVLELFTLGMGNYSEADIKEAARAFTGWGIRLLIFERGGEKIQETAKESILTGRPMVAFAFSPDLADTGAKTVLGKTANFDGDAILDMLAMHPQTARRLCTKLWETFAYPSPEPGIVERLAKIYIDNKAEIRPVLRAIMTAPEFWSAKCERALVKTPFDFVVPIVRQFGVADLLRGARKKPDKPTTPLPKTLRDASGLIAGLMNQQGMLLLFPPNVGGWPKGKAWITSNNMLERMKIADTLFGTYDNQQPLAAWLTGVIGQQYKPKGTADVVQALITIFDMPATDEQRRILTEAAEKNGGLPAMLAPKSAAALLTAVCKPMFGTPEFQMM